MPTKETIQNAIDEALVHYWELFDETPVDEDFLREQGGEISEHGLCRLGKLLITDSCLFINDPDQDQQWIMDNPTRGDVLRLLSVVGRGE